jgi:sugar phosphate isomerase/epimerase
MKTAMMTLGCPTWDLDTVIQKAAEYGFNGIDFRGLKDGLDITVLPAFTTDRAATARRIADAGLRASGISSSISVCDPIKRAQYLDEAKRTLDVGVALQIDYVRLFGGGGDLVDAGKRAEAAAVGRDCIAEILALPGASQVKWLFETHDWWVSSADCKTLLDAIPDPAFGALWDIGHTARLCSETPEQSYAALGQRVGNAHIKDAVHDQSHPQAMGDGWRFVLPGTGQLPLAEGVGLLAKNGYTGWITFEQEKRWHWNLDDPEISFPAFMKWFRSLGIK